MKLFLVAFSILLSSCSLLPTKKPDAIITEKIVHVDARALEPCKPLIELSDTPSFDDVISVSVSNAEIYLDCKDRQNVSIKLLKQFSNIK
jgi:hypothetical protein